MFRRLFNNERFKLHLLKMPIPATKSHRKKMYHHYWDTIQQIHVSELPKLNNGTTFYIALEKGNKTSWTSVKIFFLLKKSRINKKQNTLTHKELALHTHIFKFLLFNFHRPQFLTTIQIRNFLKIMQSTEYFQHKDAS